MLLGINVIEEGQAGSEHDEEKLGTKALCRELC